MPKRKKGDEPCERETPDSVPEFGFSAEEFHKFIEDHRHMFVTRSWDMVSNAHRYLCGLLQTEKRLGNIERMIEDVPGSEYQSLQQFISDSPWSYREAMNQVAWEVGHLFAGGSEIGLVLDETYFKKSGSKSVGVARQWNGRLGKRENSQVAVFAALATGDRVSLIDTEFYLPKEWTDDLVRMKKAGVPEDRFEHATKLELAKRIIYRQRELGTPFDFVCADGLYGQSGEFCRWLDDTGEEFLLHVHADQHIYLEDPGLHIPPSKPGRGRKPSKLKAAVSPVRVDAFVSGLEDKDWQNIVTRDTVRGPLAIKAFARAVWLWNGEEEEAREWVLFVRQDLESGDMKYALSNAKDLSITSLGRREMQRYLVERSFQDAKQDVSMGDYQTRGWLAWHHHMALVMMAMLFITKTRMLYCNRIPLLSFSDIRRLLTYFLPQRKTTKQEVLRQMKVRHAAREKSIENKTKQKEKAMREAGFSPPPGDPPNMRHGQRNSIAK